MEEDLMPVADDGVPIAVQVINPQEVKSTISSYTTYNVTGEDKEGKFECFRRYSDFDAVRNLMVMRWPGCFVPPLPPKKILNKGEAAFVEERRRLLELFCRKLSKLKHLWYSEEFQVFLRTNNHDVEKALKVIPAQTNDQLIHKYEEKFSKLPGKEANSTTIAKIASFSSFIKRALPMLSNFKEMIQNFLELRSKHYEQFETFLSYLMPEYEKNCLVEYVNGNVEGRFVFGEATDEKLSELVARLVLDELMQKNFVSRSQFVYLYYMLECEQREIEAFAEIFKYKEGYEQRLEDFKIKEKDLNIKQQELMAGKRSFLKSIFKSNIQQDKKEVEMELDKVKLEKENFVFICDISTVILGHFEIDRFKQQKSREYFLTLRKISECEAEFAAIKEAIFEHVLENHNLV